MNEEMILEPDDDFDLANEDAVVDFMETTMDSFLRTANVEAVYGEPIREGDQLIVPAAEVVSAMGFGIGSGQGSGEDDGFASGSGGGGGGRTFSRPVAVIIASPEGVRVEPVIDFTKIALAALTAGGFMLGMFLRMLNPKKAISDLQEGEWG